MADTEETLDEQLAAIDAELLRPQSTQFGDRSRTSRRTDDLLRTRQLLMERRNALNPRPRQAIGVSSKGIW